jgi:hypothetical protein
MTRRRETFIARRRPPLGEVMQRALCAGFVIEEIERLTVPFATISAVPA